MKCDYCGSYLADYPSDGICPNCGGQLPDPPAGIRCPSCGRHSSGRFCSHCGQSLYGKPAPVRPVVQTVVQPVYVPVQPVYQPIQARPAVPGINCCPKCHSVQLIYEKRGFSWLWGLVGFFLLPLFGILLGFCGSNKTHIRCTGCRHKWKRRR